MTRHVPVRSRLIVAPFAPPGVHTAAVDVVKVTGNPDEAVADSVTGDWLMFAVGGWANAIVWLACVTLKVRVIDGAEA